jgi:hypothetical protein
MIVVRLLLILLLIAIGVTLIMFVVTRNKGYLRFAWQLFKFAVWLVVIFAALVMMGRIILYGL